MECSTVLDQIVIPDGAKEADAQSLYEVLTQVTDRRKRRGKRYEAALVLTLLLLAKMSGERGISGIAQWARLAHRVGASASVAAAQSPALWQHLS